MKLNFIPKISNNKRILKNDDQMITVAVASTVKLVQILFTFFFTFFANTVYCKHFLCCEQTELMFQLKKTLFSWHYFYESK